jgi:ribosomal protein S18 acetylase RimI-like enzyme
VSSEATIRKFRESDREAVGDITVACFDGVSSIDHNIERLLGPINGRNWAWRKRRSVDDDIVRHRDGVFVAEVDGRVVGYITTRVDRESRVGWIPNLAVLPGHRKGGIGRALLEAAVAHLRESRMACARIETLASNAAGRHFYPSFGFVEVAQQVHYVMPLERGRG